MFCILQQSMFIAFNFCFHVDVNECFDDASVCEQECANTQGSYVCSCRAGYRLQAAGRCAGTSLPLYNMATCIQY